MDEVKRRSSRAEKIDRSMVFERILELPTVRIVGVGAYAFLKDIRASQTWTWFKKNTAHFFWDRQKIRSQIEVSKRRIFLFFHFATGFFLMQFATDAHDTINSVQTKSSPLL